MRGLLAWIIGVAAFGDVVATREAFAAEFLQASDGLVSMEAENNDGNVARGGHAFVPASTVGFSGSGALEATPNAGVVRDTGYVTTSPRLDFRVDFARTGTHYVWIRGMARSVADDSLHVGLDGAEVATSDKITGFGANWTWSRFTMDSPGTTMNIPSTGIHVINLWMREDGLIVDKLLLTTDPSFQPTGLGPTQSPRDGTSEPPPACGNGVCEATEGSATCPADCGPPPPPAGAFMQSGDNNGIVSMEAEHFATNTAQGGWIWTATTGGTALQALPNTGGQPDGNQATASPRLDFLVNFVKTGTHYVWVRGSGATATDDSVHAGLDGAALPSSDRIFRFDKSLSWSRNTMDGALATVEVATVGVHTVNIWMREDGFVLDKLVVTSNRSYAPSGGGPAESPIGTTPSPVCGNGVCEATESSTTCAADCGGPPPVCGNGVCDATESSTTCPADCGPPPAVCGNGVCEATESPATCAADCGSPPPVCGNGACESGENAATCPSDCTTGSGNTWIIDGKTGSDSGSGRASAPWRTWGKLVLALNAGTINPGDRVLIRPGRYAVCEGIEWWESLRGAGGTANAPITISVDTSQPGDVEIHGGSAGGQCGNSAWQPAKQCSGGSLARAVCDTNTDCPGGGTCTTVPNVFYTTVGLGKANSWAGGIEAPGVAFQPSIAPVGGAPKIFEILYSDPTATGATPRMPAFTAGRDQFWPYPIMAQKCTAARVPFHCCTGAGTGSCGRPRGYVQTAAGTSPDTVGTAQFGPVELPTAKYVFAQGNASTAPLTYVRFTNHPEGTDTGRTFYFWWATTGIMQLGNTHHLTFEDFDVAYASRASAIYGTGGGGMTFPRFIGGDTYLINPIASNSSFGPRNVVHDVTFRWGKIHGAQGNELVHSNSGAADRFFGLTFENVEFADGPWSVPNGYSATTGTGNANTNQVSKMWPPPAYRPAWSNTYNTHWSPLGGGGMTSGAMILNTPDNVVRGCWFHDIGLVSFHEKGTNSGNVFENNLVDFGLLKYADVGAWFYNGQQMAGFHPPLPVDACTDGPDLCRGYTGSFGVTMRGRFDAPNKNGNIVRNNVFVNTYGQGLFFNDLEVPSPYAPGTPHQIVNNTFIIPGDADYLSGRDAWVPVRVWGTWGTSGVRGIIKNNVFYRSVPSATQSSLIDISAESAATSDMDYNNWGGANAAWLVGASYRTSFAEFRALMQSRAGAAAESHSLNLDPRFVLPFSDLRLQSTSPSRQTGVDLSAVGWLPSSWDYTCTVTAPASCTPRPAGRWSMGAYQ